MDTKTILIADDEVTIRTMLKDWLESFDYNILTAEDGQAAWEVWNENTCDLLITDINMPRMNGIELLQKIKEKNKDFPVIVITGVSVSSAELQSKDFGADAYLIKPFKMKDLYQKIDAIFTG